LLLLDLGLDLGDILIIHRGSDFLFYFAISTSVFCFVFGFWFVGFWFFPLCIFTYELVCISTISTQRKLSLKKTIQKLKIKTKTLTKHIHNDMQ